MVHGVSIVIRSTFSEKLSNQYHGRSFCETLAVRVLSLVLHRRVEKGDFTASDERGRCLDMETIAAGCFRGLSLDGGDHLRHDEAKPPLRDSIFTPYCLCLSRLHGFFSKNVRSAFLLPPQNGSTVADSDGS
ncbi:hypothetical protein ISN44_As05g025900 [Arabidopsis suecica]|uniref:Uncharacterized protein n=1 Tax=Arabidopsis suecica TaxID=45249 RepID=A0A8T2DET3_ARASU|nr:hypothetical protein ISN44_As05g025900 [Arabidopsis suecica]